VLLVPAYSSTACCQRNTTNCVDGQGRAADAAGDAGVDDSKRSAHGGGGRGTGQGDCFGGGVHGSRNYMLGLNYATNV